MRVWIFMLLFSVGVPAYLASVACRIARHRRKRPGLWLAPLAIAATGFLVVVCLYRGDLVRPSRWETSKAAMTLMVPLFFTISCAFATPSAFIAVALYRAKSEDENAEQRD